MSDVWQRLLTINEYYDGPIFGIAELDGKPHVYDREWNAEADEYGPRFRLSAIEPDLLALVSEDWEIWLRWDAAFKRGEIDLSSHPALPSERARHEEIKALIGNRLEAKRDGPLMKFGDLEIRNREWFVKWRDAP
jgi:hypothetical protein